MPEHSKHTCTVFSSLFVSYSRHFDKGILLSSELHKMTKWFSWAQSAAHYCTGAVKSSLVPFIPLTAALWHNLWPGPPSIFMQYSGLTPGGRLELHMVCPGCTDFHFYSASVSVCASGKKSNMEQILRILLLLSKEINSNLILWLGPGPAWCCCQSDLWAEYRAGRRGRWLPLWLICHERAFFTREIYVWIVNRSLNTRL